MSVIKLAAQNNMRAKQMFIAEDKKHEAKVSKPGNYYCCTVIHMSSQEIVRQYKSSIFNKTNIREIKRLVKKEFNITIDY
jgi:hypothetical protein